MKKDYVHIIFGGLILFASLLTLLSVPTSPFAPLTTSLGIIFIMWGIFKIKKHSNTTFFVAFSAIILLLGITLASYDASMSINGEYRTLYYNYIGIYTLLMFLIIYLFTRKLKKLNKH